MVYSYHFSLACLSRIVCGQIKNSLTGSVVTLSYRDVSGNVT
ncbi:hypothetical protein SpAn4DRAFT_0906 [Sporomusa ovata]|uniref:Uncharacterized protein n=1 Tax=Sporomusa ovata TaxID=2378 RepID=A0A0U1L6D0_9FIRM|nr:hypothetical protein SpAn4DRAFT_0906 [Sporomusa ovata]